MNKTTGNRIPRKFNMLKVEMLIDTSCDQTGDIVHIQKDDNGYLALNTRTGKYACMFVSMLRIENVCRILEIA